MKAVNSKTTENYIAECDRDLPESEQTIFKIRQLTVEQEAHIEDELGRVNQGGEFAINLGTQALLALNLGLADVENLVDDSGQAITMERDETKRYLPGKIRPWKNDSLSKIPRAVRNEVAQYIINNGKISGETEKN